MEIMFGTKKFGYKKIEVSSLRIIFHRLQRFVIEFKYLINTLIYYYSDLINYEVYSTPNLGIVERYYRLDDLFRLNFYLKMYK